MARWPFYQGRLVAIAVLAEPLAVLSSRPSPMTVLSRPANPMASLAALSDQWPLYQGLIRQHLPRSRNFERFTRRNFRSSGGKLPASSGKPWEAPGRLISSLIRSAARSLITDDWLQCQFYQPDTAKWPDPYIRARGGRFHIVSHTQFISGQAEPIEETMAVLSRPASPNGYFSKADGRFIRPAKPNGRFIKANAMGSLSRWPFYQTNGRFIEPCEVTPLCARAWRPRWATGSGPWLGELRVKLRSCGLAGSLGGARLTCVSRRVGGRV